jgi:hypothetical protein
MFIGHFAVGFAAKKASPRTSLGTLFLASQFLDLLWPVLLILGIEHVRISPGNTAVTPLDFYDYPISHSLATVLGWSVALGGIYFGVRRNFRGAAVVGVCVLSHWLLDAVVHRPDLPLFPGGSVLIGLGLWGSVGATVAVEAGMFALGVWIYLCSTAARDRVGRFALAGLIGFLAVAYLANILAPPPPSVQAVQWGSLTMWVLVPWGYWIDRHRQALPDGHGPAQ